jgi:hypothetical protein
MKSEGRRAKSEGRGAKEQGTGRGLLLLGFGLALLLAWGLATWDRPGWAALTLDERGRSVVDVWARDPFGLTRDMVMATSGTLTHAERGALVLGLFAAMEDGGSVGRLESAWRDGGVAVQGAMKRAAQRALRARREEADAQSRAALTAENALD